MPLESASSFRRCGERRRRLLTDDLSGDWSTCRVWPDDTLPPRKSEHYGDADFLEQQLRLLDLVPRRLFFLMLSLTGALGVIAGLEASYAWMLRLSEGGGAVAALDIGVRNSLAGWFSSLLLLAASGTAMLVYTVRRYRTDDYQGRYRIWLWAAACWLLVATDQAAGLREGFRDMMTTLTGTPLLGDGTLWWVALYVLMLGAVGSRLLMDMHPCRLSMGALLAAAVAYGLVLADAMGWIFMTEGGAVRTMFHAGSEMIGNLLLLAAMSLQVRHVVLDAEGLLPRSKEWGEEEELYEDEADDRRATSSGGKRWVKVDAAHVSPRSALQRKTVRSTTPAAPTPATSQAPVHRKLTKGERKALKERLLRERMERQRRGL